MAKKQIKKSKLAKPKKKKWYAIKAEGMFNNAVLGETYVAEPGLMLGKHLKVNLMALTGNIRKQNVNVKFVVKDVKDNNGLARITGYYYSPSSIKRLVRRDRDRVDLSFIIFTKDRQYLRIKPLLITKSNTSRSVLTALRKKTIYFLRENAKSLSAEELFEKIIDESIQRELKKFLNNLYPLRTCQIKSAYISKLRQRGTFVKRAKHNPSAPTKKQDKDAKPEAETTSKPGQNKGDSKSSAGNPAKSGENTAEKASA